LSFIHWVTYRYTPVASDPRDVVDDPKHLWHLTHLTHLPHPATA
jgi:hypothetical protein